MSEMVKRLARIIKDQIESDPGNFEAVARAVLDDMRDPTIEMLDAAYEADRSITLRKAASTQELRRDGARIFLRGMIDEAMK